MSQPIVGFVREHSRADIVFTRRHLLHRLPLELVYKVLHLAEYYTILYDFHRGTPIAFADGHREVAHVSPILLPRSIVKISVKTESRDDSSSPLDRILDSPNVGPRTWLELSVLRDPGRQAIKSIRVYTNKHAVRSEWQYPWQMNELNIEKDHPFLQKIEAGDTLAVTAHSSSPGSMNHVRKCKLTVRSFL